MYECFHCGNKTVGWDCDYSFEDCGIIMFDDDGNEVEEGIVHCCHCSTCGAYIEYHIPLPSLENEEEKEEGVAKEELQ